ncbi:hypothetical protein MAR_022174 [Mya arenaria]|uniref:TIR domain-containing protein n=1 Tax=Mya arenaria TaxID=6604 RepID=A0ABY7DJD0_MYAAR|nr:hypothetical protein MAR_022174 [Mya arenaria]
MAGTSGGRQRKLVHRPSEMFIEFTRQAEWDEFHFEKQMLNKSELLKESLQGFEECTAIIGDPANRNQHQFSYVNMTLRDRVVDVFTTFETLEERTVLGNKLARLKFVENLVEYYEYVLDALSLSCLTDGQVATRLEDPGIRLLLTVRRLLWDYSDSCPKFSEVIAEGGMFRQLMLDLHFICADDIKMVTLLALVHMVRENELAGLEMEAGFDLTAFITDALYMAIQSKERREHGFHVSELVDGLTALAQTKEQKRRFSAPHVLTICARILRKENQSEVLAVLKLIWELAFLEDCRIAIKSEEELLDAVRMQRFNNHYDTQYTARRAAFQLLDLPDRLNTVETRPPDFDARPHVMFSYHWGDRKSVMEIYRVLRAEGYPIWIDVAELSKHSDVTEAVKSAVEHSIVILACLSEKYKNSRNCRTELEYGFSLKRAILPLQLHTGYEADGWLRSVIGEEPDVLYFTERQPPPAQLRRLRDKLQTHIQGVTPPLYRTPSRQKSRELTRALSRGPSRGQSRATSRASVLGPISIQTVCKVLEWTPEDVEQWAFDIKLEGSAYRKVSKMSGPQVYCLFQNWMKKPESFCYWAESILHLGSVEDLARFSNAVRNLTSYVA